MNRTSKKITLSRKLPNLRALAQFYLEVNHKTGIPGYMMMPDARMRYILLRCRNVIRRSDTHQAKTLVNRINTALQDIKERKEACTMIA